MYNRSIEQLREKQYECKGELYTEDEMWMEYLFNHPFLREQKATIADFRYDNKVHDSIHSAGLIILSLSE